MTVPLTSGPCHISGCPKGARVHGWCTLHYSNWRRSGDPLKQPKRSSVERARVLAAGEQACTKCGDTKPLRAFPLYPSGTIRRVCRACRSTQIRADHLRLQLSGEKRDQGSAAARRSRRQSLKVWEAKNPEKKAAHQMVAAALKLGIITKPGSCSLCSNSTSPLQGHHGDYSKPLDVEWLCPECHGLVRFLANSSPADRVARTAVYREHIASLTELIAAVQRLPLYGRPQLADLLSLMSEPPPGLGGV